VPLLHNKNGSEWHGNNLVVRIYCGNLDRVIKQAENQSK
jgi:hypothetical protein